jgi:hypothetical protein
MWGWSGLGPKNLAENARLFLPGRAIVLCIGQARGSADGLQQFAVEGRFQRADGHLASVGTAVGPIKGRGSTQDVVGAIDGELAARNHAGKHGHERCDSVDDGGVDHLTFSRSSAFQESGQDADRHEQ